MAVETSTLDLEDQGFASRITGKAQRNPFLTIGVLGFLTTLGIGAYRFKKRPPGSPMSLFFIQLRVTAQSVVIGTLSVGMVYNMINQYYSKKKPVSLKPLDH